MKKSILIPIIAVGLLAVVAGVTVGLVYAYSPSEKSDLEVISVTAIAETDEVTVELECGDQTGQQQQQQQQNQNGLRRMFAYMHQFQFDNCETGECMLQEQIQNQWQHQVQAGKTMMYQFHIEGLEHGMMLQLRFEYNNGKVLMHQFQVNS
ncbi:MAG: hypothetical protein KGD59_02040 [Candidatus Heimdallarchaeota archaeon]|nr:hypothetical protein [Candidatus Heimdallarchaeota archaeon]MBY8993301.1 hypothetical protein [Candidatus Heimdallarchaeota archaeon]